MSEGDEPSVELSVPSMDCHSCAEKVGRSLDQLEDVGEYETHPGVGRVIVHGGRADRSRIVAAIERAGYPVAESDADHLSPNDVWLSPRGIKTWIGAVLLVIGLVFEFALPDPVLLARFGVEFTVAWAAYLGAAGVAGQAVLRNGLASLQTRSLDIDLLMSAGIVGAIIVGLPFEAATLAVLFSIAELLEQFSMDRARRSLRELMALSPDSATVIRNGEEQTVDVDAVEIGDMVVVRPGEKIPVDGVVREGSSAVDESPITGESVPADKAPGDEVYAGTVNEGGYLQLETTATADESTISRVIALVESAERGKTEREQFVDRFAGYYTPIIVIGAILTVLLSPTVFGITWTEAFVRGLTLLVVACPCAFVISTPVSVVSGITSAARNGVLVKGGDDLERMGDVDTVAFDKTGTLTTGELGVTDVIPLNGNDEEDLLRCARAIEARSEHPIGQAIVAYANETGVEDRAITEFEALTGAGVRAVLDGVQHYAGKPGLFEDLGFDLEGPVPTADGGQTVAQSTSLDLAGETIPDLQAAGKTVVLVGTEDELEGVIGIADTVRPKARETISALVDRGLEAVMLTGDNDRTARAIADEIGIDTYRADLLPEDKVEAVTELREEGIVAMVGDGVNDAPALAAADVGIAMGAAGTDTAIDTADIALLGDDLTRLPYLVDLSRRANGVIRQNIVGSLAVKFVLAIAAPLGLVSVITAIVVGDMGMSLGVTGNAMRLANVE